MSRSARQLLPLKLSLLFLSLSVTCLKHAYQAGRDLRDTEAIASQNALHQEVTYSESLETIRTLREIGDPAVATLVDTASDRSLDRHLRQSATFALGSLGAAAPIPELITMLADPDEQIAFEASMALRRIGDPAVSTLAAALRNENLQVRRGAAFALAGTGASLQPAIPQIVAALGDEDENVRLQAGLALNRLGALATPALLSALQDPSDRVRQAAAFALSAPAKTTVEDTSRLQAKARRQVAARLERVRRQNRWQIACEPIPTPSGPSDPLPCNPCDPPAPCDPSPCFPAATRQDLGGDRFL